MAAVKKVFLLLLLWVSAAQAEFNIERLIRAPRSLLIGMTEKELSSQKEGLFPGPAINLRGDDFDFKTFMEIEGMGTPGHRSFYYLFENDQLQGVIQTTSLLGLEESEALRLAANNYAMVSEGGFGQPEKSEILRKDEDKFSKVTLEKWVLDLEKISLFHVSTNYESSVGVLFNDTRFPTDQLYVSAEDERFKGQISDEAIIVDVSREELQKINDLRTSNRIKEKRRDLAVSDAEFKASNNSLKKEGDSVPRDQDLVENKPSYLVWMLIGCVLLGGVYVLLKSKRNEQ